MSAFERVEGNAIWTPTELAAREPATASTPASGDDLATLLKEFEELVSKREEALAWVARASADDGELDAATGAFEAAQDKLAARAGRLLAAVEAVLKQADHFASEAGRFGKLSETADEDSGAALAALSAWQAYDRCARSFREAITRALAGEEAGGG